MKFPASTFGSLLFFFFFTQGKVQLGTYFEGQVCSWSAAVSFPSSSREVPTNDADDALSVPIAFVLGSGEVRGARWSVTSRMFRGIEIISFEQRFQVINSVGKPLLVHPVLVMSGKKVTDILFIVYCFLFFLYTFIAWWILRYRKRESIGHIPPKLFFVFSIETRTWNGLV